MLGGYYGYTGTLEPYVASVLRERLERAGNLMRSILFYNIDISDNNEN